MPSPLHCQFGIFRIYFDYGFLPHTKEGEPTKNAFLIVRWLIAYFCPFRERKYVENRKKQKQKIKNKWCMLVLLCTDVCLCVLLVPLRANLALSYEKLRFRLWPGLTSWRQGPECARCDCIDYRLCLPIGSHLGTVSATGGQRLCC